jgi:hypothetical protein
MVAIVVLVDRGALDGADALVRLGVGMAVGVVVYGLTIRAGRGEAYQDVLDVLRRFVG